MVKGQGHGDLKTSKPRLHRPMVIKVDEYVVSAQQVTTIDFGVIRSKVKVTVTLNPKSCTFGPLVIKVGDYVVSDEQMTPFYFWISRSKVKVIVTFNFRLN